MDLLRRINYRAVLVFVALVALITSALVWLERGLI